MSEGMYRLHYQQTMSSNLTGEEKEDIAQRISRLTLRSPIWLDGKKDYREDFPELTPFISKGVPLTGVYLVAIMKGIVDELGS